MSNRKWSELLLRLGTSGLKRNKLKADDRNRLHNDIEFTNFYTNFLVVIANSFPRSMPVSSILSSQMSSAELRLLWSNKSIINLSKKNLRIIRFGTK